MTKASDEHPLPEVVKIPESKELSLATTPVAAVAAQAKAAIEARYLLAMHRPRDWDTVRLSVLDACKRPRFAEVARYSKPVGGTRIIGPSIRFAEEALRAMGNSLVETMVVQEDDNQRIVRVSVTDLESGLFYGQDVVVRKVVERKQLRNGQVSLGVRENTKGETVYLVEATDDELVNKQNALISKAMRTQGLRVLPSDILEEAMEQVVKTLEREDKKDPDAARKRVIDLFHQKGVTPADVETYLGHPLEQCTPAELDELRTVHNALREGEATWGAVMEMKYGEHADSEDVKAKTKGRLDDLKRRIWNREDDGEDKATRQEDLALQDREK